LYTEATAAAGGGGGGAAAGREFFSPVSQEWEKKESRSASSSLRSRATRRVCQNGRPECGPIQGCQIFLGPNIPNWKKYTKLPQTRPKGCKIYAMAVKYSKWSLNIPTFTIQRFSEIYPNLGFLV
jgi:hypothetical protein